MSTNAQPSVNPADNDSLTGTFKHILNKYMQSVDGMLPARVIAFDRVSNRVQVQPLIAVLTTNGQQVSRAQIASIPVLQVGGGGFMMNFNLIPGDLGWIQASDRDISQFLQTNNTARPNTLRIKNFADSLFVPNVLTGYTIAGEDLNNAVLQSLDGSVKISIGATRIKISAPNVVIDSSLTTLDGNLRVNGLITASGSITPFVP